MDNAFKTAAFPCMTTNQIKDTMEDAFLSLDLHRAEKLQDEVDRREKAAAGDESVMTQDERLRFIRTGKAR